MNGTRLSPSLNLRRSHNSICLHFLNINHFFTWLVACFPTWERRPHLTLSLHVYLWAWVECGLTGTPKGCGTTCVLGAPGNHYWCLFLPSARRAVICVCTLASSIRAPLVKERRSLLCTTQTWLGQSNTPLDCDNKFHEWQFHGVRISNDLTSLVTSCPSLCPFIPLSLGPGL